MTTFLRLLGEKDKLQQLMSATSAFREGATDLRIFDVDPDTFELIPGAPFTYWASEVLRGVFKAHPPFESGNRTSKQGLATADDGRFLRVWWECLPDTVHETKDWALLVKGGSPDKFFTDPIATVKWRNDGRELKAFASWYRSSRGWGDQWSAMINSTEYYFQPGFTWPLRASEFAPSAMPAGCAFSTRGCAGIVPEGDLQWLIALMSSRPFDYIFKLRLGRFGFPEFSSGSLQPMPIPDLAPEVKDKLERLFSSAWSLKRALSTTDETSHAFHLPAALLPRLGSYDPPSIEGKLSNLQLEIDELAFELYGFDNEDRAAVQGLAGTGEAGVSDESGDDLDPEIEGGNEAMDQGDGLLSWAVGVAFGRFDWRLATGEREAPPEPDPFDPLPAISPGMLPDGAASFHTHGGILVDDQGHPHDLPRLIEEVLARVEAEIPGDVRRWLQRDFFPLHLKQYSKSRRKAPIYWPLSTISGSYTLWLYYPSLTSQTLYSAVNDFIEPKLKQVGREADVLRNKGAARTRDDEKSLEALQNLELELIELRDTLLQIAPTYRPNHDDGVQITAAPLWQLFRHKPWQKILKDTWAKLEKGEYDWAHLAMAYWPDRVRGKCKTDKSLAIAHDLEALYIEPEPRSPKSGKLKKDAE